MNFFGQVTDIFIFFLKGSLFFILLYEPLNKLLIFYPLLIFFFFGLSYHASFHFQALGEVSDFVQEPKVLDLFLGDDFFALRAVLTFSFWFFKQDGVHASLTYAMLFGTQNHWIQGILSYSSVHRGHSKSDLGLKKSGFKFTASLYRFCMKINTKLNSMEGNSLIISVCPSSSDIVLKFYQTGLNCNRWRGGRLVFKQW